MTVPWWYTEIKDCDFALLEKARSSRKLSCGPFVDEFEEVVSQLNYGAKCVATTSGTAALTLAGMVSGIKPGDEVIVPNRTWIATAHAFSILGAKIRIANTDQYMRIQDESILSLVTEKTKAIVPVSLNGRSSVTQRTINLCQNKGISLIEDSAQSFCLDKEHRRKKMEKLKYIWTYSFSMAKQIVTGQGGMICTHNNEIYMDALKYRTHGMPIGNINSADAWTTPGHNFRFNDLQAAIGIKQVERNSEKKAKLKNIYRLYESTLLNNNIKLIKSDIESGEVPIYIEALCNNRQKLINYLKSHNIEVREFYPDISKARYLRSNEVYEKSKFSTKGIYLPSGDGQKLEDLQRVIKLLNEFENR